MTLPKPAPHHDSPEPDAGGDAGGPDLSAIEQAARAMAERNPRRPASLDAATPVPTAAQIAAPQTDPPAVSAAKPPAASQAASSSALEARRDELQNALVAPNPTALAAPLRHTYTARVASGPTPIAQRGAATAPRPLLDDHFRLSLTPWQSAAVTVGIIALVIGAVGMAASGWVAAYHWSCRVGLMSNYCAPAPDLKPLAPPEIPT